MSDLKWFVCRGEGYVREPIALSELISNWRRYPIFGAQKGSKYVCYDRICARLGRDPYKIVWLDRFEMETRAG